MAYLSDRRCLNIMVFRVQGFGVHGLGLKASGVGGLGFGGFGGLRFRVVWGFKVQGAFA